MFYHRRLKPYFVRLIAVCGCFMSGCGGSQSESEATYVMCNGNPTELVVVESENRVLLVGEDGQVTAQPLSMCAEHASQTLPCEKDNSCTCKDYGNCANACEYTDSCTCEDYGNCEEKLECEEDNSCTCKDYGNCEYACEYTDSCTCKDYSNCTCEDEGNCGDVVHLRLMAANITSGSHQAYEAPGIHVFQALKPDIVMIQEFSYESGTRADFVKLAFGEEYEFSFSPVDTPAYSPNVIPNGIVSRYPIIEHGFWEARGGSTNRNWDWALIDIPGDRDLLAVSVHLTINGTNNERPNLAKRIAEKVGDKNYYIALGGDFNTKSRGGAESHFKSLFQIKKCNDTECTYPVDQNGLDLTSGQRDDPYDWLLFDHEFDRFEVPVIIGDHVYENGHVFDACVYFEHDELEDVSPVVASDCGDVDLTEHEVVDRVANMQHMAVIRDVEYTIE